MVLLKTRASMFALVGSLLLLPQFALAQAVGSTCYLERAIDFVFTQDNGDVIDLKLSAGEVLRMVGGDAESRVVVWGHYESVMALDILMGSCSWSAPGEAPRPAKKQVLKEEDPWSSADPAEAAPPAGEVQPSTPQPPDHGVPTDTSLQVLVFPLSTDGVPARMADLVTTYLVREIRKLEDVRVITVEMLPEIIQDRFENCRASGRPECYAGVAEQSKVDEAVLGAVRDSADGRSMNLKRIQREGSNVLASFDESLDANDNAAFVRVLGLAVERLFDGKEVAMGRMRGVRADVLARLDPPPIPSWATYVVGGVAVAAGGAAGALGYLASEEETKFNQPEGVSPYAGADFVDIQNRAVGYQNATNALLISGGVALLATGIMALFTDWEGIPAPE